MTKSIRNPQSRSIHGWIAHELGTRIVTGAYPPGVYIPNEAAICEELGVSRTVLREAFKSLKAKGLLESRPKLGTRVRPRQCWNMFDADILAWYFEFGPSAEFLTSLFEMREIIEPNAAALAAQRATQEQIKAIENAYFAMETARAGTDEVVSSDTDFHMAILVATNNEFMISLGESIKSALMGLFRISSSQQSEYSNALPGHKAVYLGIKDRDPERARFEMQSLLSKSIRGATEILSKGAESISRAL